MRRTHTPRFPCAEETEHGFSRHVGSRKETNIIKAGHQQAQGIRLIAAKNNKKRGGGAAVRSQAVAHKPSPERPPTYNSRDRKIALPKRFR